MPKQLDSREHAILADSLLRLDQLRIDLAALVDQEKSEAKLLLNLLSNVEGQEYTVNKRRAYVSTPVSLTIDPDVYRAACDKARVAARTAESAITQKVLIAKAKKLLGEKIVSDISRKKRGTPRVLIVSASRG